MKRFTNKKRIVAAGAAVVLSAGLATAAFAYFTSSGSGTGSATVGTDTPFTIGGTAAGYAYPGAPGQTVTLTAYNNSTGNEAIGSPIYLASVNACPEGTTYQSGSSDCWDGVALDAHVPALSDCQSVAPGNVANDTSKTWWMADVTTTQDFAPGVTTTIMPTGTLVMNDTTFNQNDCKNANLTLNFATR